MDANEFLAWRKAEGFSQGQAADVLGKSRPTIARWEAGTTPIPGDVAEMIGSHGTPAPAATAVVAVLTPKPRAFDPIKEGLKPCRPSPNLQPRDWVRCPLMAGWQRVGDRVVRASIPDPIDFDPPEWAGWRGVVTASGAVYDYETGVEMRDHHNALAVRSFTPNATKPGGGYLKAKHRPEARP